MNIPCDYPITWVHWYESLGYLTPLQHLNVWYETMSITWQLIGRYGDGVDIAMVMSPVSFFLNATYYTHILITFYLLLCFNQIT